MRKPAFCICVNKDADQQLHDQRLCFCYIDGKIPLLLKTEISSLWQSSVVVQPGFCWTWSETSHDMANIKNSSGEHHTAWGL